LLNAGDNPTALRCVVIVGYDHQKELFKFKNTWGKNWGDKGYGYIHYNDAYTIILSAYVFTEIE
jgi:C1A family cysteine protease